MEIETVTVKQLENVVRKLQNCMIDLDFPFCSTTENLSYFKSGQTFLLADARLNHAHAALVDLRWCWCHHSHHRLNGRATGGRRRTDGRGRTHSAPPSTKREAKLECRWLARPPARSSLLRSVGGAGRRSLAPRRRSPLAPR